MIEFETERAGNRFASIKGIGEKAVEKWEEQIENWIRDNAREIEASEQDNN